MDTASHASQATFRPAFHSDLLLQVLLVFLQLIHRGARQSERHVFAQFAAELVDLRLQALARVGLLELRRGFFAEPRGAFLTPHCRLGSELGRCEIRIGGATPAQHAAAAGRARRAFLCRRRRCAVVLVSQSPSLFAVLAAAMAVAARLVVATLRRAAATHV
mmetsp:Transcript_48851/g.150895  ORF Transcript_48851/g.150895 Transcript_48851/m.150895 type:complete len:162 (-) Transcript_48851:34-519(-)